jgi:predicted lipid-binding transport protein (Tim44 family)
MFSKYEENLQKAEESFMPPASAQKEEELFDNQEFLENFDFLFNPQEEAFDLEEYEEMKSIIKK